MPDFRLSCSWLSVDLTLSIIGCNYADQYLHILQKCIYEIHHK